jgi:hypothetical protein
MAAVKLAAQIMKAKQISIGHISQQLNGSLKSKNWF